MIVQTLMAFDRFVGIDVNLHKLTPGCSKKSNSGRSCAAGATAALPEPVTS
ncbi:hypothetical protein LP420_09580 [Massilia sp. B-10]|nr:hypothetical protein LP420_09580 [Massilia sp. B-10]UUZ57565.1 hypothetical protein LP419_09000 [Massilia sp. H-1]